MDEHKKEGIVPPILQEAWRESVIVNCSWLLRKQTCWKQKTKVGESYMLISLSFYF